jgi:bifunctional NMN adenylyltransferase/nudix hydrolase
MFDICVFAGRMRPPTSAHLANIRAGLVAAQYTFVMIGSAHEAPHFKNPHTFEEVSQMIRASLMPAENDRVFIFGIEDRESNLLWVRDVQKIATEQAKRLSFGREPRIALIGYAKDGSSYYLKMFPGWDSVATQAVLHTEDSMVSATDIRNAIYDADVPEAEVERLYRCEPQLIPQGTYLFLRQWVNTAQFRLMQAEYKFMIHEYLPLFPKNPYTGDPQQFPCADLFMFHAGAVCLVQRAKMPGKGLWASPGGHKRAYQTFLDAALDETGQETQLYDLNPWLTRDTLASYIRGEKMLDNPWRSNREVTFSMAYGALIPASQPRPIIKGADDAKQARWWNTDEVTRAMTFEDHFNPFEFFLNSFRDLTF